MARGVHSSGDGGLESDALPPDAWFDTDDGDSDADSPGVDRDTVGLAEIGGAVISAINRQRIYKRWNPTGRVGETNGRKVADGEHSVESTVGNGATGTVGNGQQPNTSRVDHPSNKSGRTLKVSPGDARVGTPPNREFKDSTFSCLIKDLRHNSNGDMIVQLVVPYSDTEEAIKLRHAYHKMVLCTIERKKAQ